MTTPDLPFAELTRRFLLHRQSPAAAQIPSRSAGNRARQPAACS